jgi:hypothetical protein
MGKSNSRAARFSDAVGLVSDAKATFEELMEELTNWKDNLPENLQLGSKADMLDEAISNLEQIISSCDEVEGTDVEFPGMFG